MQGTAIAESPNGFTPMTNGNAPGDAKTKVLDALNNDGHVWRTVDGLAKDTSLSHADVLAQLEALPQNTLAVTNSKAGKLYTTREHYFKNQSFFGRFLTYATGQFK